MTYSVQPYITYKCGHTVLAPAHVETDIALKNYSRWAKGQAFCPTCWGNKKVDEAFTFACQQLWADLEGSYKQVRWALSIRQTMLTEIDLAERTLAAFSDDLAQRTRLRLAHDRLARSTKAESWIEARDLTMDELVELALEETSAEEIAEPCLVAVA